MASLPSRPYDALYDPTFIVSGARDHYKQQGQSGGFLIERIPEHANLFSELQHYPTSTFRLKGNDKLPAHVDRSFHAHQPSHSHLLQQSQAAQVNGPQQYRYFRRPNLPPGARMSAALHLAPPKVQTPDQPAPSEPLIKDAATQSDYRETETQTLPWSPDWVLPTDPARLAKQAALSQKFNCQGPEVLQLADLRFGDGLPGGLQEVRRLEKMREKRAFEASLPAIDDAARLPERQAMIEAWEAQEWAEREDEIKGVQEERLALLENALMVREEEIEEAHRAQLAERTSNVLSGKSQKFAGIHASRIKTIRQLAEKRKKVDALSKGNTQKASIIDKYADYGSAVYAPLQREGRFPDVVKAPTAAGALVPQQIGTGVQKPGVQKPGLNADQFVPASITGLHDLQSSLPIRALEPKLNKPKVPTKLNYTQRLEQAIQHDVEIVGNLLQTAKQTTGRGVGQVWPYPVDEAAASSIGTGTIKGHGRSTAGQLGTGSARPSVADSKPAVAAKAKTVSGERASTPEAPPLADATGQHAALVLLQRLLRGRAVQDEMSAGKAANLQLIRELRLGLEGTAGSQPRPETRDAFTQELDAVIGAAVCEVCCLLASDDETAITQLLLSIAAEQQKQQDQQQQQLLQQQPGQGQIGTQLEQQGQEGQEDQPEQQASDQEEQQGQEGQPEQRTSDQEKQKGQEGQPEQQQSGQEEQQGQEDQPEQQTSDQEEQQGQEGQQERQASDQEEQKGQEGQTEQQQSGQEEAGIQVDQQDQQEQQQSYVQAETNTQQQAHDRADTQQEQQDCQGEPRQSRGAVEAIRQEISAHEVLQQQQSAQLQQLEEQTSASEGSKEHLMLQQPKDVLTAAAAAGEEPGSDSARRQDAATRVHYTYNEVAEEAAAAAELPSSLQPQPTNRQPQQQLLVQSNLAEDDLQAQQSVGLALQPDGCSSLQQEPQSGGTPSSRPGSGNSEASSSEYVGAAGNRPGSCEPSLAEGVGRAGHLGSLGNSVANYSAGAVGSVVSLGYGMHADQSSESPHVAGVLDRQDEQQDADGEQQ